MELCHSSNFDRVCSAVLSSCTNWFRISYSINDASTVELCVTVAYLAVEHCVTKSLNSLLDDCIGFILFCMVVIKLRSVYKKKDESQNILF